MSEHALSWEADLFELPSDTGMYMETHPTGGGVCSCLCGWESKRETGEDVKSFREQGNAHIEPFMVPELAPVLPVETRTEWAVRLYAYDGSPVREWEHLTEDEARMDLAVCRDQFRDAGNAHADIRLVSRTVSTTPWEEVQ